MLILIKRKLLTLVETKLSRVLKQEINQKYVSFENLWSLEVNFIIQIVHFNSNFSAPFCLLLFPYDISINCILS